MRYFVRAALSLAAVVPLAAVVGGCTTYARTEPAVVTTPAPATPVVVAATDPTVVSYPEGKYRLYGDGTTTPYYWAWIPNGVQMYAPPAPPAVPARMAAVPVTPPPPGVVVTAPATASSGGRYQLYGDGSTTPYYWVWLPAGSTAPPPPPIPTR